MTTDEDLVRLCFKLAIEAKAAGNGSYGSLITDEAGQIIVRAGNTTSADNSVTRHAEMNAIQEAENIRGKGKLEGCTLYSSAEPCPMCASAIVWSGLTEVVYGASISSLEEMGEFQIGIDSRSVFKHAAREIHTEGPLLEKEALELF